MSKPKEQKSYDLQSISSKQGTISRSSIWEICKKQEKLIQLLKKQMNSLKQVIVQMERDIGRYDGVMRQLCKECGVGYNVIEDLCGVVEQMRNKIRQKKNNKQQAVYQTNEHPQSVTSQQIIYKQIIKQIPIWVQKQIQIVKQIPIYVQKQIVKEIIKQVQRPIFVQKIRQVQKAVFVEKIIQIPCASCQLAAHQRIKT